jgi:uncharacterized protein DUF1579
MKKMAMCLMLGFAIIATAKDKPKSSGEDMGKPMEKKTGGKMSMPMMKPSPEMQELSKMVVGTWSSAEKQEPSPWAPKGATGKGTAVFKNGPGGLSVIQDYKSSSGMGGFAGHGVLWWDAQARGYKGIWCDSMTPGGCQISKGLAKWDGNNLVGTDESEMMGQKVAMKETWTDITPNSFTFVMEGGPPGGEMKRMMTIKYTRMGAATVETKKP